MGFLIGEPVTVRRADTTIDRYGNTTPDWTYITDTVVAGCAVAPRSSAEDNDGRTAVIVGLTVYMPEGTDVLPSDRLVIRGVVHEVDGEAGDWRSPFSARRPGLEVPVRRVDG